VPDPATPVSPYLVVKGAAEAIAFYERAFGARELFRLSEPSGKVGHAELDIRGARLMLADEYPDFGAISPAALGGTPVRLHLAVADADAVVAKAEAAGATVLRPLRNQFFGERNALIADPFGHQWFVSSRIEDVTPAEMQRRWSEAIGSG
jgi:PhnB protein